MTRRRLVETVARAVGAAAWAGLVCGSLWWVAPGGPAAGAQIDPVAAPAVTGLRVVVALAAVGAGAGSVLALAASAGSALLGRPARRRPGLDRIRRLATGAALANLVVATWAGPVSAGPGHGSPPPDDPSTQSLDRLDRAEVPALHPLSSPPASTTTTTTTSHPLPVTVLAGPEAPPVRASTPVEDATDRHHVVEPGDSFWSIARARARGSDTPVSTYWLRLMEANADRLVVPGEFDLIRPGQVLRLPPR